MPSLFARRFMAAALLLVFAGSVAAYSGEIVSTMRNVNAVAEAQGFRLNPAFDMVLERGPDEKGDPQAFEILRPLDQGVTIGRIYTSCTCIQLVAHKRTFEPGERAVLHLRNVRETPINGQIYAIYVQITSPVRATLRFDTFVQSNNIINPEEETTEEDAAEDANDGAENAAAEAPAAAAPAAPAPEVAVADDEAMTEENLPEIPGIELIIPGSQAAAEEVEETAAEAEEAARTAANDVEDALRSELAAARAELDAIMRTRSEELSAEAPRSDEVRAAIDSYFEQKSEAAPATPATPATPAAPAATAAALPPPAASDSGWQVVAQAPAAARDAVVDAAVAVRDAVAPAAAGNRAAPLGDVPVRAVSLITIGVRDMIRSIAFYEAIGWERAARTKYDSTAFFQLHGQVLALYPLEDMLREQGMSGARPAPGGITLALHVQNQDDVHAAYKRFIDAGGVSLKEPAVMPSGSVTCYVADPDGNPWEISWVPQFVVDGDGGLWLR